MKVALVCDWLTNVGGAEKVLLAIHRMYPEAPIYTSQYSEKKIDWFKDADVRVGWMRIFPCRWRRFLGWFRARYFSHLDLSDYDLVISVTGAEAKAVKTKKAARKSERYDDQSNCSTKSKNCQEGQGAVHVSYCHVPTQYYWQMYDDYVKDPGFGILNPLVRVCFKLFVKPLRARDFEAAQEVDQFVTISAYAQEMIRKYYKQDSIIVPPPVEVQSFRAGPVRNYFSEVKGLEFLRMSYAGQPAEPPLRGEPVGVVRNIRPQKFKSDRGRDDLRKTVCGHPPYSKITGGLGSEFLPPYFSPYYITTSRQVTWKRIDLCVQACVKMGRRLVVIGEGPEHEKLVKLAAGAVDDEGRALVEFLPVMKREELAQYLAGAKGYLFPSLEPFGIAPVEALASGCPVIAYKKGGALDYVKDGENGVLFSRQSVASLCEGIEKFEKMKFSREKVVASVKDFGVERFEEELRKVVDDTKNN